MLVQTRGEAIANANKNQTRSQQVEALKTGLGQSDEPWAPAYLAFPFSIYTDKSGGELAGHAAIIEAVTADDEDANETDRKTTAEPVPDAA